MKLLQLKNKAGDVVAEAMVDDDDFEVVSRVSWYLVPGNYVTRTTYRSGKKDNERLHRAVLGLSPGDPEIVDHINRNPLDCRKENLRIVDHGQNLQNQGLRSDNKSGYRGVWRDPKTGSYLAYATVRQRRKHLGSFRTAEEAAAAASAWRAEHMPFSEDARALA